MGKKILLQELCISLHIESNYCFLKCVCWHSHLFLACTGSEMSAYYIVMFEYCLLIICKVCTIFFTQIM